MVNPNGMADQVIDLTDSPPPEYITIDADVGEEPASGETLAITQSELGRDSDRKKNRRRKRKRPLAEEDSPISAAQTREASLEEGEVKASAFWQEDPRLPKGNRKDVVEAEHEHIYQSHRDTKPQNRHYSRSPCRKETPPIEPIPNDSNIFFIDVKPSPLPTTSIFVAPIIVGAQAGPSLLLPAHVSVFGTTPIEILPSPSMDSDGEDYIDYLDVDDRKGVTRYFEAPVDETAKKLRILCKHCGAEGNHKTSECSVLICLTCGARNEHPTRSCPISKTCFSCGMKGHINATCPNRRKALNSSDLNRYDDCDRCGSHSHKTNECPTLWRLYEYFTDKDKDRIIRIREEQRHLSLGQGGEGYIANDEWCYNCGNRGHWGDDCQDVPHNKDLPNEQSAFGVYNLSSGPFYDPHSEPTSSTLSRREPRDWEKANDLPGDWGNDAPDNVGRQARRKNIARMEKKAQEQAADDPDDWFGNLKQDTSHRLPSRNDNDSSSGPKIISFGKSLKDAARQFQPPQTKISLLERLGDSVHRNHSQDRQPRSSRGRHDYNSRRDDKYARDRDWDNHRSRGEPGPRYKGGYRR